MLLSMEGAEWHLCGGGFLTATCSQMKVGNAELQKLFLNRISNPLRFPQSQSHAPEPRNGFAV